MILVDTSVWIDHLRADNALLAGLLNSGRVLTDPFVIGELALGHMRQRDVVLASLLHLPRAGVATDAEVLRFIDRPSAGRSGHRLRRCPLACGRATEGRRGTLDQGRKASSRRRGAYCGDETPPLLIGPASSVAARKKCYGRA